MQSSEGHKDQQHIRILYLKKKLSVQSPGALISSQSPGSLIPNYPYL